jgi:hypothetical protein
MSLYSPLPGDDDRRQHRELGALRLLEDLVDHLLRRLLADLLAALRAVLHADGGVEHAQVVVDLGDRAHRRARVVGGGLLLDGDGGRQPADGVVLGLVHLAQELPGVGRQALDVAALPLGVEGVEGQRALAAAGDAGEDHQPLLGDVEIDALQVVLARTTDGDLVWLGHGCGAPSCLAAWMS